jgi:DNA-3-methyladenine glycosylase I
MNRCAWVNLNNPLYVTYHDQEWGVFNDNPQYLYEQFILETFVAGLSWEIILNKREAFRLAYHQFDRDQVSKYRKKDVTRLLKNKDIIRHQAKIEASIVNTKIYLAIENAYHSFLHYLLTFTQKKMTIHCPKTIKDVLTSNAVSDAISQDLKKRGMKFVGSTTIYAFLQAIGMIDDHTCECDKKASHKLCKI